MSEQQETSDGEQRPRYTHDCDRCKFLGHYESDYATGATHPFDLYVCPGLLGHTTVIARMGDEGAEYYSGMEFAKPYVDGAGQTRAGIPMLVEARQRAIAQGFFQDAEAA